MEERKEPITIKSTKSPLTLTHILLITLIAAVVALGVIIAFKDFGGDKTPQKKVKDARHDYTAGDLNANKKYGDILEIPHGLEGYFDLDEAIAAAKEADKPIFVDIAGHACNNCREMEASVWSNDKVMRYLEQDYIICALYVDDKTELAKEDYYIDANGSVHTKLGPKNIAIAKERWGVSWGKPSQPRYILLTPDGEAMLMPEPMGYDRDIEKFVAFLQTGLDNKAAGIKYATAQDKPIFVDAGDNAYLNEEPYEIKGKAAGINYATAQDKPIFVDAGDNAYLNEEPFEIKGSVYDMKGDSEISWKVTSYRVEAGIYEIRFDGKISKGFHGYPMSDFSAPIFFVGDSEIAASEVSEPLKDQLVDMHGDKVYQGNVEYVFYVDGNSGDTVRGSVMATICSDEDNFCTQADHEFEVRLQ